MAEAHGEAGQAVTQEQLRNLLAKAASGFEKDSGFEPSPIGGLALEDVLALAALARDQLRQTEQDLDSDIRRVERCVDTLRTRRNVYGFVRAEAIRAVGLDDTRSFDHVPVEEKAARAVTRAMDLKAGT
jgi:hypothetical protein